MRILLISRCPPWPLYLGDRLIVYHLAEELEARGHTLDLLAFTQRPEDPAEQSLYDHRFASVQLFPEPHRGQISYLRRLLLPWTRWPRAAHQSWSPPMWTAIQSALARTPYDAIHLFGGIQVYEFAGALAGRPAIITPYESYALYLRRALDHARLSPPPYEVGRGPGGGDTLQTPKRGHPSLAQPSHGQVTPTDSSPVLKLPPSLRMILASWRFKSPRIGEEPTPEKRRGPGGGDLQLLAARRYESFMFTPYARTVVVSDRDRDELLSLNPALPVEVIPNGVDTRGFRPRPTARIPALLFVGNYDYPPNVDAARYLAQDIFPVVRERLPQARLWLVGNAPPPELRALASESIRVTGRVPDVRPYLARAGAFVSPLRLGAGIKNKVLEALAMGCPVIATPLSLDGIAARDGHEVLVAEGPALAEAALRLLQDVGLSRQLSLNGRRLIESRYSWDHVAERYLALYAALGPQSHSPPPPSQL